MWKKKKREKKSNQTGCGKHRRLEQRYKPPHIFMSTNLADRLKLTEIQTEANAPQTNDYRSWSTARNPPFVQLSSP